MNQPCTHPNAYPGLECYCPDCKQTFGAGTAKHNEIISRDSPRQPSHKSFVLGDNSPPSNGSISTELLGDKFIPPSNDLTSTELLGGILDSVDCADSAPPSNDLTSTELLGGDLKVTGSDPVTPSNDLTSKDSPDTPEIPPSKMRRQKGYGSGYIECKPIIRSGREYPQYWYHYEEWLKGDRLTKRTKYIPKRLVAKIQEMEWEKAPVKEILKVLGGKEGK